MAGDKQLKDKAVSIKGKSYVLVSDRVVYFNENYPEGAIITELISSVEDDHIVMRARVYPVYKDDRNFTGWSQAIVGDGMVNKTAALENCETSAVGRALAMMGIGVIESIASVDEINKATGSNGTRQPNRINTKQILLLANKVKWGLNIQDKDEIVRWLDSVLGKSFVQLRTNEMDDAIKKVDDAIREDKVMNSMPDPKYESLDPSQLDIPTEINLEDIPY